MESMRDEMVYRSRKWGSLIDLGFYIIFIQPKFTIMIYPPPPPVYVSPQLLVIYMSICLGLLLFLLWTFSLSVSTESFLLKTAVLYFVAGIPMVIGFYVDEPALTSLLATLYLLAGCSTAAKILDKVIHPSDGRLNHCCRPLNNDARHSMLRLSRHKVALTESTQCRYLGVQHSGVQVCTTYNERYLITLIASPSLIPDES